MKHGLILFFLMSALLSSAQKFSGGFMAGYNINSFQGDKEVDASGNTIENFKNDNGFHIGAILNYAFTDNFGLRSTILYSQRGVISQFESEDSYLVLRDIQTNEREIAFGKKSINRSINNAYIEIPLMGYVKYKNFELAFGPSLGLMVTSGATGSIDFEGDWRGESVDVQSRINHKYYSQRAGEYDLEERSTFVSGFQSVGFPATHTAYFEYDEKKKSSFKPVNYGLNAHFNYYFNKGLFLGVGYYYGLNDVTTNEMDLEQYAVDGEELIFRDDDDRFSSFKVSVGFRF